MLVLLFALAGCTSLSGLDDLRAVAGDPSAEGARSSDASVGATNPDAVAEPTTREPIEDASTSPAADADAAPPLEPGPDYWAPLDFTAENRLGTCNGARYVRLDTQYDLWVGVILCSSTRYKIYLAATSDGTYYELADTSGGGEDHCELVNPSFSLGPGGAIDSGNCPSCAFDYAGTGVTGQNAGAYVRAQLGEAPVFEAVWPSSAYTGHWYECGVSIP